MGSLRTLTLTAALTLASPMIAIAGDMPAIPTIQDTGEGELELGTHWYLRGDIGYTLWHEPDIDATWTAPVAAPVRDSSLDGTWAAGTGFGYDFGWMRVDLTADYIGRRDASVGFVDFNCDTGVGDATCSGGVKGSVSAIPILLNAYADLGHWGGFTPYIGAGIGAARVNWGSWSTQVACAENGGSCPSPLGGGGDVAFSNPGASNWNFAWALMAGVSYSVSPNMSLDFGYRFLDIADGNASHGYVYPSSPSVQLGDLKDKDLFAHEFRVGFRYLVD